MGGTTAGGKTSKRKKHHDKDKYYNLAKEQGLRSRAAFKLSQINRKFPFLQDARIVLDLCAAPGGWTQIAARTMPRTEHTHIVAVDILPIRAFPGHKHNITTLIGDITTAKCKADITSTLRKVCSQAGEASTKIASVDLVLHDGAPNVGASYDKDAYEQNEIAVHALRCATQHLKRHGHFVTKVYRSRDYASYLWVCQQLFDTVTAFKPKASRVQSAEIFLVCQNYKAPDKIDPRMLDPKHIFEQVEGESTGGGNKDSTGDGVHIFHKAWDQKRRHRDGYDMTHLDATMRHIEPVSRFIEAKGMKDAIQVLSTCTGLSFHCEDCDNESKATKKPSCHCRFYLQHPLTTPENKECISDLKLLNKSDFKSLLLWRMKMQDALQAMKDMDEEDAEEASDEEDSGNGRERAEGKDSDEEESSDKEEARVQSEIEALRQKAQRERKRQKKKERAEAAKRRKRAALGLDLNAIDVPEHDKIFSLATITDKGVLEAASEVNLDQVTDEQIFGNPGDDDIVVDLDESLKKDRKDKDEETGYSYRLDEELDEAYSRYVESTKDGTAKSGTKHEKQKKKSRRLNALEETEEDEALILTAERSLGKDGKAYAELLQGPRDSDDEEESSDEDDDDDGYNAEPMTPEQFTAAKAAVTKKDSNPLIHKLENEPTSAKTARWFSNPLFASIGEKADSAIAPSKDNQSDSRRNKRKANGEEVEVESEVGGSDDDDDVQYGVNEKRRQNNGKIEKKGLDAEEILASMPKTDKQIRHEKRLKQSAREERKKAKKAKKLGDQEAAFDIVPADDNESKGEDDDDKLKDMHPSQREKILNARELIKAGIGKAAEDDATKKNGGIEIVSEADTERPLPVMDRRKYHFDNDNYDSDDMAETLALGTMMLRQSKAKALVDASYNRYAWNDPEGLPDWFTDDENRHYRPQLPIPPALIAKIKQEQMSLSEKPIKKVAEARARKNKRAKLKLAAAKKKAEAVANSTEMSEAMKLKAISKALRSQDNKKPSKTYVVAKKGRNNGAKGVKLVDKRMKNDKVAMERKLKKRTKGKQGGLVGSKKRRHHR